MRRELVCHPQTPAGHVRAVAVDLAWSRSGPVTLLFAVFCEPRHLVLPERRESGRSDGLWRTTCFELFVRSGEDAGYREFNFAPSSCWAAYAFAHYRQDAIAADLDHPPVIEVGKRSDRVEIEVRLSVALPHDATLGLSAVIEETDGTKSYWALAHPADKPDFHDPACFALRLPAATGP